MSPSLAILNHLLSQNPTLRAKLSTRYGRRVGISAPPFLIKGVIGQDGFLTACDDPAEAILHCHLAGLLDHCARHPPNGAYFRLSGDDELAQFIARCFGRIQYSAYEDLAKYLGDLCAHRIERTLEQARGAYQAFYWQLLDHGIDYLHHEKQLLPPKKDVHSFMIGVDMLRDDVERLEKHLQQLEVKYHKK